MNTEYLSNSLGYETGFRAFDSTDGLVDRGHLGIEEWTSPVVESTIPVRECTGSWNITGGHNGWAEIYLRGADETGWTLWYPLAFWAPSGSYVGRFSFSGTEDDAGAVKADYLSFKHPAAKLQMKIRCGSMRTGGVPKINAAHLSWSTERPQSAEGMAPEAYGKVDIQGLAPHSQQVYKDGGKVWCSPTCLSMVLKHYRRSNASPEACVREAVSGCWDPIEECHGNWNFNTAWTSSLGYGSFVRRHTRLSQLQGYLERGIPIPMSVSFNNGEGRPLANAPIEKTNGHIILLKGFDGEGGALVFDPAANSDDEVPRTYSCRELEARWLEASGGACYVVMPH